MSVRYIAIEPCTLPAGGCTYVFALEITRSAREPIVIRHRYSSFRQAALAVQAQQPLKAATLPPFPQKFPLRRQTPLFLVKRGRALASYLQAVLADESLSAVDHVQQLLRDGTPKADAAANHNPPSPLTQAEAVVREVGTPQSTRSPAVCIFASPPPAATPLPRQLEPVHSPEATNGYAQEGNNGYAPEGANGYAPDGTNGHHPLQQLMRHPLTALAISLFIGLLCGEVLLALGSCILGIVAGGLHTPPRDDPPLHGANGRHHGGVSHVNGHHAHPPPSVEKEPKQAARGGGEEETDDSHRVAVEAAAEALRLLHEAFDQPETRGWKPHSTRDGVQILVHVTPSGATWGMGLGEVCAPVGVVYAVQELDECKRLLDKQFDRSTTLRAIPPHLLSIDGWQTIELSLAQSLYKSPAWPVGPREFCGVRVIARRPSDGAVAVALRSLDVPGCAPPAGHTRTDLTCGGYLAIPTGPESTLMKYVNMLDPKGSIPSSVVKITVPDRAMVVARVRKIAQDRARWSCAPEWAKLS
ncbi:hypothetical protein AB1Y20_020041 [Prymnesium parvum]|uniref:PX domain-containing protein n=1 Tax=Prymnesium parvum TaxID=97485 RepID=A0AB34JU18_PRYPA